MALRALMLSKKIEEKRAEIEALREAAKGLQAREAELEQAIEEAKTEEELKTVEEEVEKLEGEKKKNAEETVTLEAELEGLEKELDEVKSSEERAKYGNAPEMQEKTERRGGKVMEIRRGFFEGMTVEERDAIINEDKVREFCERLREMKGQKRAVTGVELTIPENLLETLRDNLNRYSKLVKHVRVRPLKGKARQNIAGTIPEAVWTEMIASLNELEFGFNQIEMDGFKVGGFIPVPNSILEDSDENLISEVMDMIGQAIGIALDKAILYGKGSDGKMPMGIVTRLAQTARPGDWGANNRPWTDLHLTNIKKYNLGSAEKDKFFSPLVLALGIAKEKYSDGNKVWAMNSTTKNLLMSKAITFNAAGALVAKVDETMPIIGGKIETLEFMKDGDIAGGYGSLYTLVEREGSSMDVSEQVRFIEDQTVFKGTARYDGKPVIGEGFVLINIMNAEPTTTITFAGHDEPVQSNQEQTQE